MQRWLASQSKRPRLGIFIGLVCIPVGVVGLVTATGSERIYAVVVLFIGLFQGAIGVAGLRQRRSASVDRTEDPS